MNRRRILATALALLWSRADAQTKVHRIGYLSTRASRAAIDDAFLAGMRELGYVEGRNLAIEYRWAGNDTERLRPLADELVRLDVDVVVTATTAGVRAAMQATPTIPIVMAAAADPVGAGLVTSLGRPGGNVTGLSLQTTDMARKRLQLAQELVPGARRVALLVEKVASPSQGTTATLVAETHAAAEAAGLQLFATEIAAAADLPAALGDFGRAKAQVAIVQVSPLFLQHAARVADLAVKQKLPAIYEARNFVDAGGLASYGPDLADTYRRAASFVDKILKGAKAGELPVEQPGRLALVVNLRAARAIGLDVPQSLLLRADEVLR